MNIAGLSQHWAARERCEMIALSWDNFLRSNGDEKLPDFTFAELDKVHPHIAPMDDPSQHTESQNQVRYEDMVAVVKKRGKSGLIDLPGCEYALKSLEAMRERDLEGWMAENKYDVVVFPTNGDVALADSDENYESMLDALRDGVKYANGGRSLKHLGVPCITVPMGTLAEEKMPVGLTFCGAAYRDSDLLKYAFAYEAVSRRRESPPLTPSLLSDEIPLQSTSPPLVSSTKPVLKILSTRSISEEDNEREARLITVTGTCHLASSLKAFTNGEPSSLVSWEGNNWTWTARLTQPKIGDKYPSLAKVPRDQFMIVFIAKANNGRAAGSLILID
ncbi:hypothetical protein TASIC1_0016011800 [Trichoderma asperellum]|uniref:Uncharacterized protein n=1 Tax=Trichoderma asperellum TaxID=101201 RepID=A0A6V8R6I6_TRIAP|nr:hypothetical protein TASIC1_0016011800 [Trichoderma asperellum]